MGNASHTENNQINANHTSRKKPVDANSNENISKTMTRQEKRRCTENKNEPYKGKNMPNAGKKSKTVGHTKKSHCNEKKIVEHTGENHNNASHTENNQINANHTSRKKTVDANSNENISKTMTRQERRRCT